MTFAPQRTLFGSLVMVHNRVGDGDKFLYKKFGLERSRFQAASHLKIEVKESFS